MSVASWLDGAISAVAPAAGLRRAKARIGLGAAAQMGGRRAYEAASSGRLNQGGGWFASISSADTEIFAAGRALRDQSRDLVRNNPHAAKAVAALVSNIIGNGIMPRPKTGDKAKDRRIRTAFDVWSLNAECDADGELDWCGMQTLACREMVEGGEVLARRRVRRASDGYSVPLQVQLLEADFLDPFRNGPLESGSLTIQGIEIAQSGPLIGKRTAYWLYPNHPGGMWWSASGGLTSRPVPATEVLHLYERQRTQARGVPWLTPAITTLKDLADYELAEIVRKKIEACNVAVVTTDDDSEIGINRVNSQTLASEGADGPPAGVFDIHGFPVESFEPGMIAYARGGKEVRFNAPATIGGYNEYKVSQLRSAAAGVRLPYELLSGDLSQVNFSSIRSGLIEFRRAVSAWQWQQVIPLFCQPIWEWWCEAAYLGGVIEDPVVPVDWATPRFEWVNPVDDVMADNMSIRSGLRSWEDVVASGGRDPDTVFEEIAAFQEKARVRGVVLDSDPSAVSGKGVAQKNDPSGKGASPDAPLDGGRSFMADLAARSAANHDKEG